jgi:hypothetical protein
MKVRDIPFEEGTKAFHKGLVLSRPTIVAMQGNGLGGETGCSVATRLGQVGSISEPNRTVRWGQINVESFGDVQAFSKPFHLIAPSKVMLESIFGLPTRILQLRHRPQMIEFFKKYDAHDFGFPPEIIDRERSLWTSYFGSARKGNVTSAISGKNPNADEACAVVHNECIYIPYNIATPQLQPELPYPDATKNGFIRI